MLFPCSHRSLRPCTWRSWVRTEQVPHRRRRAIVRTKSLSTFFYFVILFCSVLSCSQTRGHRLCETDTHATFDYVYMAEYLPGTWGTRSGPERRFPWRAWWIPCLPRGWRSASWGICTQPPALPCRFVKNTWIYLLQLNCSLTLCKSAQWVPWPPCTVWINFNTHDYLR